VSITPSASALPVTPTPPTITPTTSAVSVTPTPTITPTTSAVSVTPTPTRTPTPTTSTAASSGIPIATTTDIRVNYSTYSYTLVKQGTFTDNNSQTPLGGLGDRDNIVDLAFVNGKYFYFGQGSTQYVVGLIGPNGGVYQDSDGVVINSFSPFTYLWAVIDYTSDGDGYISIGDYSSIYPVIDQNIIPIDGWTPSISITAVPPPSPTPTRTPTPTVTLTPTVTPTISITPTITITPTRTPTPTISITPTRTPTPTVTPSSTPPAAFSALLKEDGDALLQENGDYILLEQQ
jgi:hypothetical protein